MFILLKLFLAHLIADFVLQFEELFRLKLKSLWGHLWHALCHALVSLILLWPYLKDPSLWVFVFATSLIHLVQDVLKYRWMENKKYFFPLFVGDQILHFLVLSAVLLFPISQKVAGFPGHPGLNALYLHDEWTLCAIAFLTTAFAGNYLFHAFRTSYVPHSRKDHYITSLEIAHAIFERTLITGLFLFSRNPAVVAATPLLGLARIPLPPMNDKTDFCVSFIYSALIGLLFRLWL